MAAYSCNHVPRAERTMEHRAKKRVELKEKILCGSWERGGWREGAGGKGPSALATNRGTKRQVFGASGKSAVLLTKASSLICKLTPLQRCSAVKGEVWIRPAPSDFSRLKQQHRGQPMILLTHRAQKGYLWGHFNICHFRKPCVATVGKIIQEWQKPAAECEKKHMYRISKMLKHCLVQIYSEVISQINQHWINCPIISCSVTCGCSMKCNASKCKSTFMMTQIWDCSMRTTHRSFWSASILHTLFSFLFLSFCLPITLENVHSSANQLGCVGLQVCLGWRSANRQNKIFEVGQLELWKQNIRQPWGVCEVRKEFT